MKIFNRKSKYPNRVKDLETIRSVFDKYGVRVLLVYGAVLGFRRDGDFIEHDDDIDLAVIDPIDFKVRKAIGWDLYRLGFQPQNIAFNVPNASGFEMEPSYPGYNGDGETGIIVCERNYKFTIFFFREEKCVTHNQQEYVCTPMLGALKLISTPTRFFVKPETIKINGKRYLVPAPTTDYLEFSYKNWKSRTDRDHSPTYTESHPDYKEMIDITGKNEATIYK